MGFGKWLVTRRESRGLTQSQLAERARVSVSYISALEREESNSKDGSPRTPKADKVERIAKALGVDKDEALIAAGYAPAILTTGKPQTVEELMDILTRVGIDGLQFADGDDALKHATPDDLREVLEAVRIAVEITIQRQSHKQKE